MPTQAAILVNAERLLSDAQLLLENGRCASAFALAILALEEIGKAVLEVWDIRNGKSNSKPFISSHINKQAAVSSLLLAVYSINFSNSGPASHKDDDEKIEKLAKSMYESEEGKFDRHVTIGAVDKAKQLAIYRDEWFESIGAYDCDFTPLEVTKEFDRCRRAIAALNDPKTMHVGAAIYKARERLTKSPFSRVRHEPRVGLSAD